ncbi:hypothetical protein FEF26_04255 [Nesterenkonia salmonea]|uniref:Uncharacterized protein n=1 Tax=Nesterenkonia salmonea TaxID=1804987 RepID=A0A5R9BDC0_9MICC|nr:hypothetical protein [Nesterenkonia salmonea]TLP98616.1 hypothetical protein FEF26_04255 [Nesterenkonia salmonea]
MPEHKTTGETAQQITPEDTGRWLITSQGTQHIWDLDKMTYMRMPSAASKSGSRVYDNMPMQITRVVWWTEVGDRAYLWFDDLEHPRFFERYRMSSVIRKIERLSDKDGEQA